MGGARWVPAWLLVMAGMVVLLRSDVPLEWWLPLGVAAVAAVVTLIITLVLEQQRALVHRLVAVVGAGVWTAWVARSGPSTLLVLAALGGGAIVAALEVAAARGRPTVLWVGPAPADVDRRPGRVQEWEALLRRVVVKKGSEGASAQIRVTEVTPWPDRTAGEQVHVELPEGMTVKDLAAYADRIAAARRLPAGCVVRTLDGPHQGAAVLDVMLRDGLAGDGRTITEPTTPASIYDPIDVAYTARGEALSVSLREQSMIVGGTTGSGKTTLLHRLIMHLARCTDTLIWVVDPNGGGVAAPWIGPWARGEAPAPTVDWVAEDPYEAAVLVSTAAAIVKDRKTSQEALRRKRQANSHILPVDRDLPLIMVITDEGGELRQMAGLLATLVDEGIARLAQIGRAEGGRVIMSVLRGTADLLGKGLRSVAGVRVCLRMNEEDECDYILGVNPGRARLLHRGSAYVYRTDTDYRPVLGRTLNVDLAAIEQHAVATAHLRPTLDDRARRVAARLTVQDVLDGRDPMQHLEIARHPVMRDVAAGRAYEGRWERKARMLAELRGEELPEEEEPARQVLPDRPTVAAPGSAAERLLLATGVRVDTPAAVAVETDARPRLRLVPDTGEAEEPTRPSTAREAILAVLNDARPDPLRAAEVHARVAADYGIEVTPQRVHQVLAALVKAGDVRQAGGGRYEMAN